MSEQRPCGVEGGFGRLVLRMAVWLWEGRWTPTTSTGRGHSQGGARAGSEGTELEYTRLQQAQGQRS